MENENLSLGEYVKSVLPTFERVFPALLPHVVSFVYNLHLGQYKDIKAEDIKKNADKIVFSNLYFIRESSIKYLEYAVDHRNYEGHIEAIDYILEGIINHPEQFPLDSIYQRKIDVMMCKRKQVNKTD